MATFTRRQVRSLRSARKPPSSLYASLRKSSKRRKAIDELFVDLKDFRRNTNVKGRHNSDREGSCSADTMDFKCPEDMFQDLDVFYIRQLASSLKDYDIQQKIDIEIKMRDGITKLLAACKHELQALEASKSLLASNYRMMAFMSELQKRKRAEKIKQSQDADDVKPCKARLAISDIRIPLMWKEEDHIKNKGDHRRYSVFCLWKIGTEIRDTEMIRNVDRTVTDMCPEDVLIFDNISPDFECFLEVYCYNMHNDMTIASTPKRLRKKLNSLSLGKSSGKKVQASVENGDSYPGPKFTMVATAKLSMDDIHSDTKTQDLALRDTENTPVQLPLFGHFCCRLAAQPECMVEDGMSGFLSFQDTVNGVPGWTRKWCLLRESQLQCWTQQEDRGSKAPECTITITKGSNVEHRDGSTIQKPNSFVLTCLEEDTKHKYTISADSKSEKELWIKALEQQFVDTAAWQQGCVELMDIQIPSPRRPLKFPSRKGSLYDDTPLKDSDSDLDDT
ncbi:rhotekin-like isoform X2 [Ptychodera flava]|uniref:rhotekin-like isoform X2 n=1 Tax=Ptychodera flava TaxID=63121 RepID=UPI00396A995F